MARVILGKTYVDEIHHVDGIATVRSEHLTGCARVCLEKLVDGEIKEYWFDESQLIGIDVDDLGGPGKVEPKRDRK